jgi:hypothetical protein
MSDFRKDIPSPWRFVFYTLVFGCVFVFGCISHGDKNPLHIAMFFSGGCFTGFFLWAIIVTAKKPSPWLRQNIGLIAKIGGGIVAALTLWNILDKK